MNFDKMEESLDANMLLALYIMTQRQK